MSAGAAEADVRVGVAQDVKCERILENLFVEVSRPVEHHHPLTLLNLYAGQLVVPQRGALKSGDRGCPAHDLIGRGLRTHFLVQLPLVGVFSERHHALGDGVAGGLVTGHRQHHHEEAELVVGELLAVDIGLDQLSHDVVGGVLRLLLGHLHRIADQLRRGRLRIDVGVFRILVAGHLV